MSARPALAVSLYVAGRRCLVVGAGPLAAERAARLSAAGADVLLRSAAEYRADLLPGTFMVFCCDASLGPAVSRDARVRGVLVHVLDMPELSDCAMPALARRGPLQIAVSTDGVAPALSSRLRAELERLLAENGAEVDALVEDMARLRESAPPAGRADALRRQAGRLSLVGRVEILPRDDD